MKYCSYPICFTLLLVYSLSVQAVDINSRVSRNPVAVNESFQLILQTEDTPDGQPDFSPLTRDFDILNQRQRENIKMINGEFSRTIGWTVTLIPRRAGSLKIPQIRFGTDRSQSIQLTVGESPRDRQEDTSADRNRSSDTPFRGFGSNREVRRPRSDSLTLEVRPVPGELPSSPRSPAVASGIRPSVPEPAGPGMSATPEQATSQKNSVSASSHLPWLLALLVSVCVLAGLAWWFRGRDESTVEPPAGPKSTAPRKTQGTRGKRLKQACLANDAETAGKELLVWAGVHWPNAPPTALNTLAGCFAGSNAEREIRSLERYLYAAKKGKWDGRPLWQAMKDLITDQGDTMGEEALVSPSYQR